MIAPNLSGYAEVYAKAAIKPEVVVEASILRFGAKVGIGMSAPHLKGAASLNGIVGKRCRIIRQTQLIVASQ